MEEKEKIKDLVIGIDIEGGIQYFKNKGLSEQEAIDKAVKEAKKDIQEGIIKTILLSELIEYQRSSDGTKISGRISICIDNDNFTESGKIIGKYYHDIVATFDDVNGDNIEIRGRRSREAGAMTEDDRLHLESLGWTIDGSCFERPKRKDTII